MNTDTLLPRLLELICDLYEDSRGFPDRTDDAQLWYNRGYANGVIHALDQLGYARHVASALEPDGPDPIAGQEALPWGRAYRHGWEMGRKEAFEVIDDEPLATDLR
ncbi:MAG: hypothetical protein LGR52_03085 [Candidatus Thiosymbion ectosymbiont of Robbea hypermnestra]|nr:hypothetical protein [Candidatus Thiosymbion ectosymbiont of Robbea hypermnestra]